MALNKTENLAIFSPMQNAYSETFIQAHRQLPFKIKFYHGGFLPNQLEGEKDLYDFSFREKIILRLNKKFNLTEHALYFSLKREGINCVLAEYGPTACESLGVLKKLNIPLIVHFHGFDATSNEVIVKYKDCYPKLFSYADNVIAVSEKMKNDLISLGCNEKKIIVTPCGPSPEYSKLQPFFERKQFIAVARFVEVKGYLLTLSAFKKVLDKHPDANLVCIGDGPQLESCKQFTKITNIENVVSFRGAQKPEEIKKELEQSSVFVQHSVTLNGGLTEGSPVSIMEAMSAGLPVVGSRSGGIVDLVLHKETGFLVNEFEIDEMANYMIQLIEDKSLAKKMGVSGRKRIENELSQEKHLGIIEHLIANVFFKQTL